MDEREFERLADEELFRIEAILERASNDAEFDFEARPGGVIEITCGNGSKIIINRHTAAREIWLAAKSGGYHFRPALDTGRWTDTRSGEELLAAIARTLEAQTGSPVSF